MDVVPTDEKNVRRAIRTGVGDALRSHYGDVLKEIIPTRLTELLEHLDELPVRRTWLESGER
jgi:Anti-sigma factor NepR